MIYNWQKLIVIINVMVIVVRKVESFWTSLAQSARLLATSLDKLAVRTVNCPCWAESCISWMILAYYKNKRTKNDFRV